MVNQNRKKKRVKKQAEKARRKAKRRGGEKTTRARIPKIGPKTPHGVCSERLSGFGGVLSLVKFLDLIQFKEVFEKEYVRPKRQTLLGCYRMVLGILLLLYTGFQRIGHFVHIRQDVMLCGFLEVERFPVVSTFWRYLQSLTIVQSQSLLRLMAVLRSRVWQVCDFHPRRVGVNIDTTVGTVYGKIEGSHKGHNTKNRGKKGLRPVLCFLDETREYLSGSQRRGMTITGKEVANQIRSFRRYLPACVKDILVRGDGEFIGWESVSACMDKEFSFIFGNRRCTPSFPEAGWYKHEEHEYNECLYQPTGWAKPCRFVVMRIEKEKKGSRQLPLFETGNYVQRVFVTNLKKKPHTVIQKYDKRADVENAIGEAQREGILAIPSKRFQPNHAFFQLVMLAYNLWRWIKLVAGAQQREIVEMEEGEAPRKIAVVDQTVHFTRLKMLYVAAKVVYHSNRDTVYYSIHESRASGIIDFFNYLDLRREERIPWKDLLPRTQHRSVG